MRLQWGQIIICNFKKIHHRLQVYIIMENNLYIYLFVYMCVSARAYISIHRRINLLTYIKNPYLFNEKTIKKKHILFNIED